ncbi:MAG: hypothetical protein H6837_00655 [Planctomycetes bacterium]|nr:hypothetical protein [Planctomycetota bacterium]
MGVEKVVLFVRGRWTGVDLLLAETGQRFVPTGAARHRVQGEASCWRIEVRRLDPGQEPVLRFVEAPGALAPKRPAPR